MIELAVICSPFRPMLTRRDVLPTSDGGRPPLNALEQIFVEQVLERVANVCMVWG